MGAPAPSLRLESQVVAPNAAIVLGGNFNLSRTFEVRAHKQAIELAEPEIWAPFGPLNPGQERFLLLRPASGEWPSKTRLDIVSEGSPRGEFRVQISGERAITPPTVGAFGEPYETNFDLPIFGRQHLLYFPHEAMRSAHSPVLWLEVSFERDRSEYTTTMVGAIAANADGILETRPFGGGLLPAIAEVRATDTARNHTVHFPPRK